MSDLVSSEESDVDEDEEVLKVCSLPWRSSKVTKMFQQLDMEAAKTKTPQSRRQRRGVWHSWQSDISCIRQLNLV